MPAASPFSSTTGRRCNGSSGGPRRCHRQSGNIAISVPLVERVQARELGLCCLRILVDPVAISQVFRTQAALKSRRREAQKDWSVKLDVRRRSCFRSANLGRILQGSATELARVLEGVGRVFEGSWNFLGWSFEGPSKLPHPIEDSG